MRSLYVRKLKKVTYLINNKMPYGRSVSKRYASYAKRGKYTKSRTSYKNRYKKPVYRKKRYFKKRY